MNPSPLAMTVAAIMFASIAAYAVLAGADFGGGIWDLLAGGRQRGAAPRALIDESITSVWEGNHVWLVVMLVVLWTGFPTAFAPIMIAMFIPLFLSLLGIFCRGVGFSFRHSAHSALSRRVYGALFAASSFMTPFFLGVVAGAIATGAIRPGVTGNRLAAWTSPTALLAGVLAISICAYIAGAYLVGDARHRHDAALVRYFSRRALAAGVVTGLLAAATLLALRSGGRYVFDGLLGRALPLLIISIGAGVLGLFLIALRRDWALRAVAATAVTATIFGWGVAQYPWLLPRTLSLTDGAAPTGALVLEVVVAGLLVLLVLPGFAVLYLLQQRGALTETDSSDELRAAVAAQAVAARAGERTAPAPEPVPGERLIAALVWWAGLTGVLRRLRGRRSGRVR